MFYDRFKIKHYFKMSQPKFTHKKLDPFSNRKFNFALLSCKLLNWFLVILKDVLKFSTRI